MSENLSTVRRLIDAFISEDLAKAMAADPHSSAIASVLGEVAAPDFDSASIAPGPLRTDYEGIDGLLEWWSGWAGAFQSYRIEAEGDPVGSGDAIVSYTRQIATPHGTDATIETPAAAVWFFRDGRLVRIEFHLDREKALRAAGIAQEPNSQE